MTRLSRVPRRVARTVLRGVGRSNAPHLPDRPAHPPARPGVNAPAGAALYSSRIGEGTISTDDKETGMDSPHQRWG